MKYRDLSFSLRAVSSPGHVLNGGPPGATFPGWFLTIQENEGYDTICGPEQLTTDQVLVIANAMEEIVPYIPDVITSSVKSCDQGMLDELVRQLDAAEKAAAKIPQLRKLLGREDA